MATAECYQSCEAEWTASPAAVQIHDRLVYINRLHGLPHAIHGASCTREYRERRRVARAGVRAEFSQSGPDAM